MQFSCACTYCDQCVWFCLIFLTVFYKIRLWSFAPYPGFTVWSSARGGVTVDIPWSPPHHITSECALEGNAKKEVQLFDKLIVGDPGPGGYHFKWVPANRIGELANCGLNVDTSSACLLRGKGLTISVIPAFTGFYCRSPSSYSALSAN